MGRNSNIKTLLSLGKSNDEFTQDSLFEQKILYRAKLDEYYKLEGINYR
jgi:hypothetical protein